MNSVNLIGNLTRDVEVAYTNGDNPMAIAKFGIAINEGYGERKKTTFLNITVFGKTAETCEKYLRKGSKAAISGRIQTGSYEKDGQRINTFDIVANNVEFLDTKNNNAEPKTEEPMQGFMALDDAVPF